VNEHEPAAAGAPAGESAGAGGRVFLSHASVDAETARRVCVELERAGLECWIAPRDIRPGGDWSEEILGGIDAASALVVFVSPTSNASRQVAREVERADDRGLPLLPFRLADIEPSGRLEYFLSGRQWIDAFRPPFAARVEELVEGLQASGAAGDGARRPALPLPDPVADIPPDDWDRRKSSGWLRRFLDDG
jgi:hypothetical protein